MDYRKNFNESKLSLSSWLGIGAGFGAIIGIILGFVQGIRLGLTGMFFGARDGAIIWGLIGCLGGFGIGLFGGIITFLFGKKERTIISGIIYWTGIATLVGALAVGIMKVYDWAIVWVIIGALGGWVESRDDIVKNN